MVITSPIFRWLIGVQTFLLILLAVLYIYLIFFGVEGRHQNISSYEECLVSEGSSLQESYPATCVTRNQQRFVQPLTAEEAAKLLPPTPALTPMPTTGN